MKKSLVIATTLCCALIAGHGYVQSGEHDDADGADGQGTPLTLAVVGDWPYSLGLVAAAPLLINSINADPNVRLVVHVGDIHSGSMPCTDDTTCPY